MYRKTQWEQVHGGGWVDTRVQEDSMGTGIGAGGGGWKHVYRKTHWEQVHGDGWVGGWEHVYRNTWEQAKYMGVYGKSG